MKKNQKFGGISQTSTAIALAILLAACGAQRASPVVEAIQATQSDAIDSSLNTIRSPDSVTQSFPSKIIGENNLVKVKADGSNVDSSLRGLLNAFGLITIGGNGACTATHLGNGYVLTAGHCFVADETNPNQTYANKDCSDIKVYWGYRGSPATGSAKPAVSKISQCTKIIYGELTPASDFAIFKVDSAPNAKIAIATETKRTVSNTKLTIFGYPQARPLEWSQFCALKPNSAVSLGGFKGPSTFVHQCDTEPGNSGSSIIAINASGVAKVIGVHDGSTPAEYNYGTFMYDIRAKLKSKGLDLDKATSGGFSI
jgi:V8-like Glu-specific endopeptidase